MILGKYNQSKTITFDLFAIDGIDLSVAATFAAGDVKIQKDEGVEANTTNLPTDEGSTYSLVLTATEMSAARIRIILIDQTATKVWLDVSLGIETYGNASAEHAFDLDTASTAQTADHTAGIADIPTVSEFNARTLVAASYFDPAADAVANVTLVATTTTNTDMVSAAPTSTAIADAVWDEAQSGHVTVGTFGKFLDVEVSSVSGGGGLTQQNVADAMKLAPTAGAPAAGSVNLALDNIEADTNELQADDIPTTLATLATAANLTTVDTVVDGIQTDLSNATDGLGAIKASVDAIPTTAMRGTDNAATATALATVDANVDSILVDTAEIGVAGVGLTNIGTIATVTDVTNRVTANTDQIGGSATAATNLSASALGIETGAATATTLTTTTMSTNLTEATDDHYIGRIIVWTSGVLANQATDITDYTGTTKLLTFTATTEAPGNTDTFVIV